MRSMNREGAPGRPALPLTVAGAGSAVASAVLVSSGVGPLASVGLAVGFLGAAVTMVVSGKRAVEVQGDPFVNIFFSCSFFKHASFSLARARSLSFFLIPTPRKRNTNRTTTKKKLLQAWPGPRAWPVFTAIASFAAASAFLQAFVYGGGQ